MVIPGGGRIAGGHPGVGVSVPATASSGQAANLTLDHMTRSIPHHATMAETAP
jgi:hypothetical protein